MNWPCPITGGAVTRMSAASFARACKSRMDTKDNNTCKACRGRKAHWPPELEIREEDVGKTTSKEIVDAVGPLKAEQDGLRQIVADVANTLGVNTDTVPGAVKAMVSINQRNLQELDAAKARIEALEAELAACRAEAPAGDRGAECLDVGAAVYRDALADFGASVLAGRVLVTFRDAP